MPEFLENVLAFFRGMWYKLDKLYMNGPASGVRPDKQGEKTMLRLYYADYAYYYFALSTFLIMLFGVASA